MSRNWMFRATVMVVLVGASLAPGCVTGDDDDPEQATPHERVAECTVGQVLGEEWSANTQHVTQACSTNCMSVKIVKTIYWYEGETLRSRVEDPGCPGSV